jgi:hypothetical protein
MNSDSLIALAVVAIAFYATVALMIAQNLPL